jgi:uncharacterized membrane protein YdbT with pleckstrin-like domain
MFLGEIAMFDLHIRKRAARQNQHHVDASLGADVSAQQAHRRWLLAFAGSVVAAIAIAAGLPITDLAIYLTITLPFVFFA